MRGMVCQSLEEVLGKEIGDKEDIVVVEKLAGTTPKSAIVFLSAYPRARYKIYNLADSSPVYLERARKMCRACGLDFELFTDRVEYNHGVNLFKRRLTEVFGRERADVIVYWGAALKCLDSFKGSLEEEYLHHFEIETRRWGKDHENRHRAMRTFHRQYTQRGLTRDELYDILADDVACLKKNGILITNFEKDLARIFDIMFQLQMAGVNYKFIYPTDFKYYEKTITVWWKKN